MARAQRERALFLRSFLAHPRKVGAVLPTSRFAVSDLLDLAPIGQARLVVEFGAGTGVYTGEILKRLRPDDARLLAFEIDPRLAGDLRARLPDPRLRVIAESAENVDAHIGGEPVDVIVSALPFTSLPAGVRTSVLEASRRILRPGGVLLVLQYSPFIEGALRQAFPVVQRRISPLNVPPAFLYACRTTTPAVRP